MSDRAVLDHDWFSRPLPPHLVLEEGSWLHSSYAFLHCRSERGVRVGRHSGIYIGTAFNLTEAGQVTIGEHCTIGGATFTGAVEVTIGDHVLVSYEVVVSDDSLGLPPEVHPRPRDPVPITIEDNAWIGARAVLLPGAMIGANAIVGAATVVDFAVPDDAIVAGNPPRIVGSVHDRSGTR
ncbi:MAG: acyltransferase [Actinobacteria bacterium]|nr:acyltransferase [Actinomycetota bacterium]